MLSLRAVRRRLAGVHGDDGITLTELVVTMTLMSIVGALSLSFFLGSSASDARTIDSAQTAAGARNAVTAWSGLLQVADSTSPGGTDDRITALTPTSITFAADLDNRPTCSTAPCPTTATTPVTLALVSTTSGTTTTTQLVQTITRTSGSTRLVQVPAGVAAAGGCLFRPYDATNAQLPCSGLTVAQRATITRIDIAFTVTPQTGPVQTYRTSVAVPGSTA
jgi:type II secretory pathway pseudopilin PulG